MFLQSPATADQSIKKRRFASYIGRRVVYVIHDFHHLFQLQRLEGFRFRKIHNNLRRVSFLVSLVNDMNNTNEITENLIDTISRNGYIF